MPSKQGYRYSYLTHMEASMKGPRGLMCGEALYSRSQVVITLVTSSYKGSQ